MTRSELKDYILNSVVGPYDLNNMEIYTPVSLYNATIWLADIANDQAAADLPEDERMPGDVAPSALMEVWNDICLEKIRSVVDCPEVPVESIFYGKKTGDVIIIQRYGHDDYGAVWYDTYSVRGSLRDIMEEVKEEI